jgi:TetR/AcrR family transcriptional repressor of nem operon
MKHFSELTPSAERIVDAAENLIKAVGYNGFSYEGISQAVGIRKPSVHHHFPSKTELGAVVAQRYTHRFKEALLRIEGVFAKPNERLVAFAKLFEATYANDRNLCVCGMLGAENDSLPNEVVIEVRKFFQVTLDWLVGVISEAQSKGAFRVNISPKIWAITFLSAMEGAMLVGRSLQAQEGPEMVADALIESMTNHD